MREKTARKFTWARLSGGAMVFAVFIAGMLVAGAGIASAAVGDRWPQATWYTVIARPGDTLSALGAR